MHYHRDYWETKAQQMAFPSYAIIDGTRVQATSGASYANRSAIDQSILCHIPDCDSRDIHKAVNAARDSFNSGCWSALAPAKRKKVLLKLAALITAHAEELALLETLDMGKPITDSLSVDIPSSANAIAWHAEAIDKLYDEIAPCSGDELGLITREPLGVVAAIVPWNFPLNMACWKLGPALATGNSVVLKPSEKSPLTAIKLTELALEAGIPPGVLNVVTGYGQAAGEPLVRHMDVDGLVFTGSTPVGKHLLSLAGQTNMKRTFVECGGKSANIVFADAEDLDLAAKTAAAAIFYNQGEVCTAGSRLLVEASIADEFIDKVISAAAAFAPKHPLDPNCSMGAIVDEQQFVRIQNYINDAQEQGATLAHTLSAAAPSNGYYIPPTILTGVTPDMRIAQQEVFGPVLSCITFTSDAEALAIANDTPFGLAAGVWTQNLKRAHKVAKGLRAGSVWVNNYFGGDMTAPFGGFKQSGNGRDKSLHAMEKYTELKATWINLA
ncbi:aldehyde dehydrogenase [Alteromonas sp. C1M14]|uniref:aldehyde dehydrogenase n=1 Tax=Alteromonas sp. C1M14 TaxID=2841567 RepID=UPI001C085FDF|nr:aldehyde dehydrogenase [Alteromonas sp. C1M14]MBU2978538.1 aldehyde dehydrogenase [Alteromonas sp. C1M14]